MLVTMLAVYIGIGAVVVKLIAHHSGAEDLADSLWRWLLVLCWPIVAFAWLCGVIAKAVFL